MHGFLPFWWDISNFNVGLQSVTELHNFFLEHLSSWSVLEVLGGKLDFVEGCVGEEFLVCKLVLVVPVGVSEVLVMVRNIIELFGKLLNGSVVEVNTVMGLLEVVLKDMANIVPLLDESLSIIGFKELLVKCFDSVCSWAVSPFTDSLFEFLGGWGILDFLGNLNDVLAFLLDFLLTPWGN